MWRKGNAGLGGWLPLCVLLRLGHEYGPLEWQHGKEGGDVHV